MQLDLGTGSLKSDRSSVATTNQNISATSVVNEKRLTDLLVQICIDCNCRLHYFGHIESFAKFKATSNVFETTFERDRK